MQSIKRYALVVCLSATVVMSAAVKDSHRATHRLGSLDDSIITQILEFFGIVPQSRVSLPPGDVELEGRLSIPPG